MSDQKPEEEKKPVDYLQAAKDNCNSVTYLNTGSAQRSITCSLIFVGEQLAKQNDVLEGVHNALEFILEAIQQNGLK